jgi:glutaminyl-tRNA synthetase
MRAGEFADGAHVLRARIDMASPNINMRDPDVVPDRHAAHHRTGDAWCIYPTYDYAHPISDAIEGITHSLCTLEFEDHRPLYDWCVDSLIETAREFKSRPQQIEFARLNLNYTVMSKRKLLALVQQQLVSGWDDPRMPTIAGIRRRGYTAEAVARLLRADWRREEGKRHRYRAARAHRARRPQSSRAASARRAAAAQARDRKLSGGTRRAARSRQQSGDPSAGTRRIPFSRVLYIEQDDFMETPPKKFLPAVPRQRSAPAVCVHHQVRARSVKDAGGAIIEVRCSYDPESLNGGTASRRVKGTIHWVSADHAGDAEIRLYDRLFSSEDPGADGRDPIEDLNPQSLEIIAGAKVEPSLVSAAAGARFQFERQGYFCADPDGRPGAPVFNRTVTLKDSWARIQKRA